MSVNHYLNRVLPPASPKMTGVCGGTWKYPFPFWTLFSCSPFTEGTRTQSNCKTLKHNEWRFRHPALIYNSRKWCQVERWIQTFKFPEHHCRGLLDLVSWKSCKARPISPALEKGLGAPIISVWDEKHAHPMLIPYPYQSHCAEQLLTPDAMMPLQNSAGEHLVCKFATKCFRFLVCQLKT